MKKLLFILLLALAVPIPRQARADIAADDSRDVYTGNGSTTVFTYNFKILTSANIAVYQAGTLKTLTTHYTLTGVNNDAGGTVVFVTAPATGEQVLLLRAQPISQTTSYIDGAISATTIERDFDRQTSVNQQQQEEINRGLKYPRTITPSAALTELPAPVASKCIGYDGAGTALALNDCAGGSGSGVSFTTSAGFFGLITDEVGGDKVVGSDNPAFTTKITAPRVDINTCQELTGAGSPEGVVSAPVCSTYRRTDGGASTTFYAKETGATGNTGWVPHGNPAGSGAPTTVPYITTVPDGGVSAEFALSTLATGLLKNTTGTGIPTIAVLDTDYLSPASPITNGQLPAIISSKTFDNTNVFNVKTNIFTFQDDTDTTKQGRFSLAAQATSTTSTFAFPVGSTTLLGDSDFAGTHAGPLIRTGNSTYKACRDNEAGTTAPGPTADSASNYCVGSMWLDTVTSKWYRAITVGVATATWQDLGSSVSTDTLSTVMGRGNAVVAESFASGLQITNTGATVVVSRYVDPTLGPRDQCSPECDATTFIPTNKNWNIYDQEGAANVLVVDPDAATKNAMYQFGAAYKPVASLAVPLTERGAVTIALASIVANQPKAYYATITDADTDALDFEFPITAKMVGATTATVRLIGVSDHAAPSGNIVFSCAMKAYRPGTDTYTAHDTTGQVNVTLTPAVTNRPVAATSTAITINGTVADGGTMVGSCEVDAAGTTSTQLTDFFLLARATIQISVNSLSD